MTDLSLFGVKNTLKKDSSSGSSSVAAPATATPWVGGTDFYTPTTISHNLGYIPQVRVYYENSDSDGKVYPAGGRRNGGTYPGLPFNSIICLFDLSTTALTIYLESNTAKTGSRTIYYDIYKDL